MIPAMALSNYKWAENHVHTKSTRMFVSFILITKTWKQPKISAGGERAINNLIDMPRCYGILFIDAKKLSSLKYGNLEEV